MQIQPWPRFNRRPELRSVSSCILLDGKMPGNGGYGMGRRIAADPDVEWIALVLMCPLGQEKRSRSLTKLGFAGRLSKPVWESSLHEALARALRGESDAASCELPRKSRQCRSDGTRSNRKPQREFWSSRTTRRISRSLWPFCASSGTKRRRWGMAREALEALRRADYDIVLMDCEMPGNGRLRDGAAYPAASSGCAILTFRSLP